MSQPTYDGGPAFPREDYQASDAPGQRGMSLRDYFAAHALPTLLDGRLWGTGELREVATLAYRIADEMLKARAMK